MARVTVLIGEQRSQWEEEFEALAARLHVALGRLALRIDHIGSTSVKGLPAKDVIDVQVVVHRLEPFEDLAEAFARAGFTRRAGDWNLHDHQPAGWIGPASDWEKLCSVQHLGNALATSTSESRAGRTRDTPSCLGTI
jgi:dephospho-CoA kinase